MSTTAIAGPARQASSAAPAPAKRALPYRTISWVVPVLLLLAWELACRTGLIAANVLPAPSSVGTTAWHLTETGELPHHDVAHVEGVDAPAIVPDLHPAEVRR